MSILTHNFTVDIDELGRRIVPISSRPISVSCSLDISTCGYDPALHKMNDWKEETLNKVIDEFRAYLSSALDEAVNAIVRETPTLGIGNLIMAKESISVYYTHPVIALEVIINGLITGYIYIDKKSHSIVYKNETANFSCTILDVSFLDESFPDILPGGKEKCVEYLVAHYCELLFHNLWNSVILEDMHDCDLAYYTAISQKARTHLMYVVAKYLEERYNEQPMKEDQNMILEYLKDYNKRWKIVSGGMTVHTIDSMGFPLTRSGYDRDEFQVNNLYTLAVFEPLQNIRKERDDLYYYQFDDSRTSSGITFVRIMDMRDIRSREVLGTIIQSGDKGDYPVLIYEPLNSDSVLPLFDESMMLDKVCLDENIKNGMRGIITKISKFHNLDAKVVMDQTLDRNEAFLKTCVQTYMKAVFEIRKKKRRT